MSVVKKELPLRLNSRIQGALFDNKRKAKTPEEVLNYQCRAEGNSGSGKSYYFFSNNDSPDVFAISTWYSGEDWARREYMVISSDDRVYSFIEPIIKEWIEDMWDYYQKS